MVYNAGNMQPDQPATTAKLPLSRQAAESRVRFVGWAHIIMGGLFLVRDIAEFTTQSLFMHSNLLGIVISVLVILIGYLLLQKSQAGYTMFRVVNLLSAVLGGLALVVIAAWLLPALPFILSALFNSSFLATSIIIGALLLAISPILSIVFLVVMNPQEVRDLFHGRGQQTQSTARG